MKELHQDNTELQSEANVSRCCREGGIPQFVACQSLGQRWKLANAELEEAMGLTCELRIPVTSSLADCCLPDGPGFSKDNPSKNAGLISEFGLLGGSLLSLKDAAVSKPRI